MKMIWIWQLFLERFVYCSQFLVTDSICGKQIGLFTLECLFRLRILTPENIRVTSITQVLFTREQYLVLYYIYEISDKFIRHKEKSNMHVVW
jgi:hypothetical protein